MTLVMFQQLKCDVYLLTQSLVSIVTLSFTNPNGKILKEDVVLHWLVHLFVCLFVCIENDMTLKNVALLTNQRCEHGRNYVVMKSAYSKFKVNDLGLLNILKDLYECLNKKICMLQEGLKSIRQFYGQLQNRKIGRLLKLFLVTHSRQPKLLILFLELPDHFFF
ncbi:hypothetical protein RFI_27684 [Reticulomyxa filosa]|uniref:Uncharacterized protein n=1 Tax=Reticulomyxa filosa TaxID=46433 RepID=X6M897_RETFI|nr:hypothetical protein RFI_27684 [Reticulomyxa filosa]|eukprot:ETO09692.1 hypothetical protein RFI_27684 [Reticulomyxa filosa]